MALNMRFERLAALAKKIEDEARAGDPPPEDAVSVIGEAIGEIAGAVDRHSR